MHGGLTPRGYGLPQTKHGRYSKDLPTRLAARYKQAVQDPDLLNLRSEIGLVDTRLAELVSGLDGEASSRLWDAVQATTAGLRKAALSGDTVAMARIIQELERLSAEGLATFSAWGDILTLLDQRRKLVDSERRRQEAMQQSITVEKAMLMIAAIASIIKDYVPDTRIRERISADIGNLLVEGAAIPLDRSAG
jgi:hypothetical protein